MRFRPRTSPRLRTSSLGLRICSFPCSETYRRAAFRTLHPAAQAATRAVLLLALLPRRPLLLLLVLLLAMAAVAVVVVVAAVAAPSLRRPAIHELT